MSISTYKVTKKSAHIQVFSFDMCRLNYGLSLYRDFFSALNNLREFFLYNKSQPVSDGYFVSAGWRFWAGRTVKTPLIVGLFRMVTGREYVIVSIRKWEKPRSVISRLRL